MLHPKTCRKSSFEFSVYNREVRAAVKDNVSHIRYGDHWADSQNQDIIASSENEAWKLVYAKYPKEYGFVIEALYPAV